MNLIWKKTVLLGMALALLLAALPAGPAHAQDEIPPTREIPPEKLAQAWARQLKLYERLEKALGESDARIQKLQERIDAAAAEGRDVAAVQAALDAFEAAVSNSRPIFEELGGIIEAHAGFDADGTVVDSVKAQETVQAVRDAMREIKTAMDGSFRKLREALREMREANRPNTPSTDPKS